MSRRSVLVFNVVLCLQILLAAYLVVLGIQGLENYNSTFNEIRRSITGLLGKTSNPFFLIFAVIEIAAGITLLITLFLPAGMQRIVFFLNLAVFIFWIMKIVIFRFMNEVLITNGEIAFKPDFLEWLTHFIADLIVLTGVWLIFKEKK